MAVFTLACIYCIGLWTGLSSAQSDRVLVYTTDDLLEERTILVLDAGDPEVWLRNLANGEVTIFPWDWTTTAFRAGSVVVDYNLPNQYFLHDRGLGQIYHISGESLSIALVSLYGGSSPQLRDMTLDWIGQNIYYTDGSTIGVWSYKNSRYQVIADDRVTPHGIDVDPENGYLFWAERTLQRIMKSTLWGTDVDSVVSGFSVQTITVDPDSQTIYWINADDNSVGTAGYDGQQINLFIGAQSPQLTAMEIYEDVLFLMELNSKYIQAYNRSTAVEIETFGLNSSNTFRQLSLAMASPETQPMVQHPCKTSNGGCQHICIPDGEDVRCLCQFGYTLNIDQSSCNTGFIADDVLFAVDLEAQQLYQVELATGEVHVVETSTGINNPRVVTFDPVENMVYWVEIGDVILIKRKSLTLSTDETFKSLGVAQCEALAIDPTGRKLYYGNNQRNTLIEKSLDTGLETILIQQNSGVTVSGIQIDDLKGHIYWTNANPPNTFVSGDMAIQRADLDTGSNRMTIVSGLDIRTLAGIALDLPAGKMYWCDYYYDKVERSNLDGTSREEIYSTDVGTCFWVAVDRTYVYVTGTHAIIRIQKSTKVVSYLGKQFYWHIVGLTSYSSSYTAKPTSKGHSLFDVKSVMFLVVVNLVLLRFSG